MLLSDLIADLRLDLWRSGAALFEDPTLDAMRPEGCFPRGASDLQIELFHRSTARSARTPDEAARNCLLILAQIHACQVMRVGHRQCVFLFQRRQAGGQDRPARAIGPSWRPICSAEYRERLARIAAGNASSTEDDYIITPSDLRPLIYDQGKRPPMLLTERERRRPWPM